MGPTLWHGDFPASSHDSLTHDVLTRYPNPYCSAACLKPIRCSQARLHLATAESRRATSWRREKWRLPRAQKTCRSRCFLRVRRTSLWKCAIRGECEKGTSPPERVFGTSSEPWWVWMVVFRVRRGSCALQFPLLAYATCCHVDIAKGRGVFIDCGAMNIWSRHCSAFYHR